MNYTFAKLPQSFYESEIYKKEDKNAINLYLTIIKHVDPYPRHPIGKKNPVELPGGHLVTGTIKLSKLSGLPRTTVRDCLKRLIKADLIIDIPQKKYRILILKDLKTRHKLFSDNGSKKCNYQQDNPPLNKNIYIYSSNTNKLKDKRAIEEKSSFKNKRRIKRVPINHEAVSKIKYSDQSCLKGRLDLSQLTWRIRQYGLEKVQYWVSEIEKRYSNKRILNANALLCNFLKNGPWYEKQALQVKQSREIENQNEKFKKEEREWAKENYEDLYGKEQKLDDKEIFKLALQNETLKITAAELVSLRMPSNHPMYIRGVKYKLIELYKNQYINKSMEINYA